jgi:hypothetical protein
MNKEKIIETVDILRDTLMLCIDELRKVLDSLNELKQDLDN